ncbi:unnamed protein product [Brachionus calyciflorus]|uniref:SRR1-like domain-containing protein n=1 Tax=Brachionus calyciflorus TaxID=104777 RepID=A0A814RIY4_9BILA|nr:unnamed protein product [Brachionus calyciflorus]
MESNLDTDGFTIVKSKKKYNSKLKLPISTQNQIKSIDSTDIDDLINKIERIKNQLLNYDSEFFVSKILIHLSKIIQDYFVQFPNGLKNRINLICYGLGSFEDSLTSRYQLVLLLIIIEELEKNYQVKIEEIYDPIFNDIDNFVIEKLLKYKPSLINNKCLKQVELGNQENCLTLVYMPHCPKALYNNFLFANWSRKHLKSFVLFGNSFATIQTLTIEENFQKYYGYLKDSLEFLNEFKLDSKCEFTNAFYDLSFITFKPEETSSPKNPFFNDDSPPLQLEAPIYDSTEEIL